MTSCAVALLPIQPRYADAILRGEKRVEFRRRAFKENVRHVVIYVGCPIQKVVGYFDVDGIETTTPSKAWKKFSSIGAIDSNSFENYYNDSATAVAIKIKSVFKLVEPIELTELHHDYTPPQSYRYLPFEIFERLRRLGTNL